MEELPANKGTKKNIDWNFNWHNLQIMFLRKKRLSKVLNITPLNLTWLIAEELKHKID